MPWDPMPTIVEKGPLFRDLEQFLKDTDNRIVMLQMLHDAGPANPAPVPPDPHVPPVDFVNAIVDTVAAPNALNWTNEIYLVPLGPPWPPPPAPGIASARAFLLERCFTQQLSIFQQILFPLTQEDLNNAAETLRIGLMDALEASMGITSSWRSPNGNGAVPGFLSHKRFWPIELNWVCGKADGFEIVTAVRRLPSSAVHLSRKGLARAVLGGGRKPFKDGVVTVNIVTPPVLNQANAFPANPNTMTIKEKRNGIMVTRFYLTSLSGTAGRVHTDFIETGDGGSNFRPPLP